MPPIAPTSPIRPSLAAFTGDPKLATAEVGLDKQPVGKLADRQIQIAFQGPGALSARSLVPQTKAAVDLLASPDGPKFERALRGLLSTVDAEKGADGVAGISLASSKDGFALNRLMTAVDLVPGVDREKVAKDLTKADITDVTKHFRRQADRAGIYAQNLSWIDLSPHASRSMLGAIKDGRTARGKAAAGLVGTLVHELHHAITPARDGVLSDANGVRPINWLEEATADVLTWQPTVLRDVSKKMGLPAPQFKNWTSVWSDQHAGYPANRAALVDVLKLAGVSLRSRAGIADASQLLQGGSLDRVPGKLADRIVQHNSLDPAHREKIRQQIRDLGAVPPGSEQQSLPHMVSMVSGARQLRQLVSELRQPPESTTA